MKIEEKLVQTLINKNLKIAACESCTGGLFCASIINVPGSSSVIDSSVVAYSNDAKIKYAGVSEKTLKEFGAVSEQTAGEMASGIRRASNAHIGIGITGIAGPGGATPNKPVGMVCFGIDINSKLTTYTQVFNNKTRMQVRKASVRFVIKKLLELL